MSRHRMSACKHWLERPATRGVLLQWVEDAYHAVLCAVAHNHMPHGAFIDSHAIAQDCKRLRKRPAAAQWVDQAMTMGMSAREAESQAMMAVLKGWLAQTEDQHSKCCAATLRDMLTASELEWEREHSRRDIAWSVGQRVALFRTSDASTHECLRGIGVIVSSADSVVVREDRRSLPMMYQDNALQRGHLRFSVRGAAEDDRGDLWRIWPAAERHEEDSWRDYLLRHVSEALAQPQFCKTSTLMRAAEALAPSAGFYETEAEALSQSPSSEWPEIKARIAEGDAKHEADGVPWWDY